MPDYVFEPPSPAAIPLLDEVAAFPVGRVYCVGRNYRAHAAEMGFSDREDPFFFLKPADSLRPVAPDETGSIAYPPQTTNLHHEVELVVAIGRAGRDIAADDAQDYIFGYAVGLDMTRRDLQIAARDLGRPWEVGKSFDDAAPISHLVRAANVRPAPDAAIRLTVNGQSRQASDLSQLIWSVPEIIAHLSRYWTLRPGDVIFTGTPEGVGAVVSGDALAASIDGLPPLTVEVR
jgi:fumarylpyruvate hydrolase